MPVLVQSFFEAHDKTSDLSPCNSLAKDERQLLFIPRVPNPQATTHYRSAACSKLGCVSEGQVHAHKILFTWAQVPFAQVPSILTSGACTQAQATSLECEAAFAQAQVPSAYAWSSIHMSGGRASSSLTPMELCTRTCACHSPHTHTHTLSWATNVERFGTASLCQLGFFSLAEMF